MIEQIWKKMIALVKEDVWVLTQKRVCVCVCVCVRKLTVIQVKLYTSKLGC